MALAALIDTFGERLAGDDPRQINRALAKLARADAGRIHNTALSAVEQALCDVTAQAESHYGTCSAARWTLRQSLYANISRGVTDRSPRGFAEAAKAAARAGFEAIKLAPFDEVHGARRVRTGGKAAWRDGVARVIAVREAVGADVQVAVDCHSRFDLSEALQVAQAMGDLDLMWFEEAVDVSRIDELRAITRTVAMPTASPKRSSSARLPAVPRSARCRFHHAGRQTRRRTAGNLADRRISAGRQRDRLTAQSRRTCRHSRKRSGHVHQRKNRLLEFPFGRSRGALTCWTHPSPWTGAAWC